jgi:serine protease Do
VIENAKEVFVTLAGNHKLQAEVVGSDSVTMIAVLRLNETTVTAARLGRTELSLPGAWAIAIGNSMGMPHAVSVGTVNGMRDDGMLQISANVDPGYSGAPVFNSSGEAIGLIAAVLNYEREDGAPIAGYFGHSTIVWPMSFLLPHAQRMIDDYYARHGWLGVTVNRTGRQDKYGVKVVHLDESGPGKKAGMQLDDVITDFDGQQLKSLSDLRRLVLKHRPGEKVEIGLLRQDAPLKIRAEIGRRRGEDYFRGAASATSATAPAVGSPPAINAPRPRQ